MFREPSLPRLTSHLTTNPIAATSDEWRGTVGILD